MKQLIIAKNKAYATSAVKYTDISAVEDGVLAIFTPNNGKLVTSAADLKSNFAVVCGRGEGKMPLHFPEVDVRSLTVEKAVPDDSTKGSLFSATVVVPATEKGEEYTVILAKTGVGFHERNRWTYTALAKSTTAADVAKALADSINANTHTTGVKAEVTIGTSTLVLTALEKGTNYEVILTDGLSGIEVTNKVVGLKPMLDKAYIQDLASRCAAGKGFNYLADDGVEIYPGYPEVVDADEYVLYTLRFAVPRVAAKQRDEVVYQILHIAVPVGAASIATLDAIFGTSDSDTGDAGDTEKP